MKKEYKDTIKAIIKKNRLSNPANPFNHKIVKDAEYDMIFNQTTNSWELSGKKTLQANNNQNDNFIVVLESPHIDEFDKNGNGKVPLVNDGYFKEKFADLLSKSNLNIQLNKYYKYKIYLVNAIQYQCSLGYPTEYYRDYVFLYYWNRKKADFENRLNAIINSKTIAIINLCTKGSHKKVTQIYNTYSKFYDYMYKNCGVRFIKKIYGYTNSNVNSLRDLVEESIINVIKNQSYKNIRYAKGTHPSLWGTGKGIIM